MTTIHFKITQNSQELLKSISAQSLSDKCKNYLLKISHSKEELLEYYFKQLTKSISPTDPYNLILLSILEKINV